MLCLLKKHNFLNIKQEDGNLNDIHFAIIGGTGVFRKNDCIDELFVETKYGKVMIEVIQMENTKVALLKRHGVTHTVPPHRINYRANLAALKTIGVKKIVATAAVGSINKCFAPGDLVLLTDYIDFTWGRENTFFDEYGEKVVHVDMTNPYCANLNADIYQASKIAGIPVNNNGAVYVCTQGPRFETSSEISMFCQLGGDLVGMTSVPEVVLAREAEICYATIAVVTNYATGISETQLTHHEVIEKMNKSAQKIEDLLKKTIEITSINVQCSCQIAVSSQTSLGG